MSWNRKIIAPADGRMVRPQFLFASPGLCRFLGTLGSLLSGMTVYFGGIRVLGLKPLDFVAPEWTAMHIILLVASLIAMGLASLFCFALAATIKVRSERVNDLFNVLWQFLANGSILWLVVLGAALTFALGREEARAFIQLAVAETSLSYVTLSVFIPGTCMGLLLGLAYFLTINGKFPFSLFVFHAFVLPLGVAYLYFLYYGLDCQWWILPGVAFPLLLRLFVPPLIERDRQQRRMIQEEAARAHFQPYKRFF